MEMPRFPAWIGNVMVVLMCIGTVAVVAALAWFFAYLIGWVVAHVRFV